jgi:hypothetical protein
MNNMDRWVDPRVSQVKAADLHAYLLARAWKRQPGSRSHVLLFEEPSRPDGKPILQTVPADESVSDYTDAVVRVITNLAAIEDRYAVDVLNDILQQTPAESVSVNGPNTTRPRPHRDQDGSRRRRPVTE